MVRIDHRLLNKVAAELVKRGWTLATVESMTAGFLSSIWSLQVDAGHLLKGGIVCFEESVKTKLLHVPQHIIDTYTAESMEVTKALIPGLKKLIPADVLISLTGVAYEGTKKHPTAEVGDVFIAVDIHGILVSRVYSLPSLNAADTYVKAFNASLALIDELLSIV